MKRLTAAFPESPSPLSRPVATRRFACLPVSDSVGRIGVECCVGLVVADPVAGLIMVPIIVKEGMDG